MFFLMINNYSTKIIQSLIGRVSFNSKFLISKVIKENINTLITNVNGLYVVSVFNKELIDFFNKILFLNPMKNEDKIRKEKLEKFLEEEIHLYNSFFITNFQNIIKDKYGCVFLQKYFAVVSQESYLRHTLICVAISSGKTLLVNKFAYYFYICLLEYNFMEYNSKLFEIYQEYPSELCKNEVSAKIFEKLLITSPSFSDLFIQNICKKINNEKVDVFLDLISDKIGYKGKLTYSFLFI